MFSLFILVSCLYILSKVEDINFTMFNLCFYSRENGDPTLHFVFTLEKMGSYFCNYYGSWLPRSIVFTDGSVGLWSSNGQGYLWHILLPCPWGRNPVYVEGRPVCLPPDPKSGWSESLVGTRLVSDMVHLHIWS